MKIFKTFIPILMMLVLWHSQAQENKLYTLGEKLVEMAKNDTTDQIAGVIAPEIDIDKKAAILESILKIRATMRNFASVDNLNLFNVVEQGEFTYILLKNGKKFNILKTQTKDGFLIAPIEMVRSELSARLTNGANIYQRRCYACHGRDGKGGIGPNLTDNYWKYVSSEENLTEIIVDGKKGTMMIAYKNYLKPKEIDDIVLYIKALHGKKVKSPKKPEGEEKKIFLKLK